MGFQSFFTRSRKRRPSETIEIESEVHRMDNEGSKTILVAP